MKKAALSTRNRKDGAFVGDEREADDRTASGESEREEARPAVPGEPLRLREDTDTSSTGVENSRLFQQTAAVLPTDFIHPLFLHHFDDHTYTFDLHTHTQTPQALCRGGPPTLRGLGNAPASVPSV